VVDLFDEGWALHYVFVKKFDVGWCTRVWQFCAGPPDPGSTWVGAWEFEPGDLITMLLLPGVRAWEFDYHDDPPPPLEFEPESSTDVVQPHQFDYHDDPPPPLEFEPESSTDVVQPHHPALQRWSIVLFDGSTVEEEVEIDWDSSTDLELDWD
jgi:hypothetical protein